MGFGKKKKKKSNILLPLSNFKYKKDQIIK
jgi:hypothetical protein